MLHGSAVLAGAAMHASGESLEHLGARVAELRVAALPEHDGAVGEGGGERDEATERLLVLAACRVLSFLAHLYI